MFSTNEKSMIINVFTIYKTSIDLNIMLATQDLNDNKRIAVILSETFI